MIKQFISFQLLLFLSLLSIKMWAQDTEPEQIALLRKSIEKELNDSAKTAMLLDLGDKIENQNPAEALACYRDAAETAKKALNSCRDKGCQNTFRALMSKALRFEGIVQLRQGETNQSVIIFRTALQFALLSGNDTEKGKAYNCLATALREEGKGDEAIALFEKSVGTALLAGDSALASSALTSLGILYGEKGNDNKAFAAFFKSLAIDEARGDVDGVARNYTNIGNLHSDRDNLTKAISYYTLSLKMALGAGNPATLQASYTNMAQAYNLTKRYDEAISYLNKALGLCRKNQDKQGESACLTNLGVANYMLGNYAMAQNHYQQALEVAESLGDVDATALLLGNLAALSIETAQRQPENTPARTLGYHLALTYSLRAYNLAREMKSVHQLEKLSTQLMKVYRMTGNHAKALEFAEVVINLRDSLFQTSKIQAISEMESKYQTERKQLEIDALEKEKALQQSLVKRQQWVIYTVVAGFLLVSVSLIAIGRLLAQKQTANKLITERNEALLKANSEITQQKEEIIAQRDEIEHQRDIVIKQKNQIEEIHHQLTDSIDYAFRIQQALLTTKSQLAALFGGVVVFYRPRNVVSGDFFWATRINNTILLAVADCTGHGVPGAMMSVLGMSYLNEIVQRKPSAMPHQILADLRTEIVAALSQTGLWNEQKEGMDMSVIAFTPSTGDLWFAGANSPLLIIKPANTLNPANIDTDCSDSDRLTYVRGDKMPVGIHDRMNPFTLHQLQLSKGDHVFLMTDGFADQFGGQQGKKFMTHRLRHFLQQTSLLTPDDQEAALQNTFDQWKGTHDQTDDVTVVGFRY